ncbi:hypothetical protein Fot_39948 [Forsythia ovata]|uniref:Uncharacterized protein n=1 Tax=Forsythia ovata TaxID=205694 RepID=A0ABD1S619_9LAMI
MKLEPSDRLRELTEVAVAEVIGDIEGDSVGGEPYSGKDMKASWCGEPSYDSPALEYTVRVFTRVTHFIAPLTKLRAHTTRIMKLPGIPLDDFFAGLVEDDTSVATATATEDEAFDSLDPD